jgi:hypothetical protein
MSRHIHLRPNFILGTHHHMPFGLPICLINCEINSCKILKQFTIQALRISKTSFYKQCNAPRLAHPNTKAEPYFRGHDACIQNMLKRSDVDAYKEYSIIAFLMESCNK